MDQLATAELMRWLEEPLAKALGARSGKLEMSLLSQPSKVADGTTVLLLSEALGGSRGVVLCSSPVSPGMVQRAMQRARLAKAVLDASAGDHILEPLAEGHVNGLSYAVLPYCEELSESGPVWWVQRALLRPRVFEWLWLATQSTVRDVGGATMKRAFTDRLQLMASLGPISDSLRGAAERAAERIDAGKWTPRHVLMHGDLWKGNVLINKETPLHATRGWRDRFVLIDWAGSEIDGYAIYDLVRMAESMRLSVGGLRSEVVRHCRVLQCLPMDAKSYLLAALGHIAMNIEHFPLDRFVHMSESCLATLDNALK